MNAQLDMFKPATAQALIGTTITVPTPCGRCRGTAALIGAGRGPHAASIICVCGRHRGWMPVAVFNFICESVRRFGRLIEPIEVRIGENRQRAPGGL